jgi:hypothetical protein
MAWSFGLEATLRVTSVVGHEASRSGMAVLHESLRFALKMLSLSSMSSWN